MGRENRARTPRGEFVQQIGPRIILDRVDRVEAKPVEMKFLNPILGVLDEEVADRAGFRSIELDRIAPRRFVPAGEEIGRVEGQEIPFGAEVAVNDVKKHGDPALVCGLDKSLEVFRSSVACVRGIEQGAVVAPVPTALEVADRHDLEGSHPKVREVVQLKSGFRERAAGRKSADMEFVKHHVFPFPSWPRFTPLIRVRVHRLAWTMNVVGLKARCGIWNSLSARQRKHIACACRQAFYEDLEKAVLYALHCDWIAAIDHQRDPFFARRPKTKLYSAVLERRAVRPFQHAVFHFGQPEPVRTRCKQVPAAAVPLAFQAVFRRS